MRLQELEEAGGYNYDGTDQRDILNFEAKSELD